VSTVLDSIQCAQLPVGPLGWYLLKANIWTREYGSTGRHGPLPFRGATSRRHTNAYQLSWRVAVPGKQIFHTLRDHCAWISELLSASIPKRARVYIDRHGGPFETKSLGNSWSSDLFDRGEMSDDSGRLAPREQCFLPQLRLVGAKRKQSSFGALVQRARVTKRHAFFMARHSLYTALKPSNPLFCHIWSVKRLSCFITHIVIRLIKPKLRYREQSVSASKTQFSFSRRNRISPSLGVLVTNNFPFHRSRFCLITSPVGDQTCQQ
jgi:hypothetical protein